MRRTLARLVVAVVVGLLGHASVGLAQSPEADKATARQLAVEAFAALDAKDYAKAEDLFARAEALHHAPTLLLGLARARAGLGKYVEAREVYLDVTREKLDADASDAFVEAVKSARAEVAAVEGQIAWVTIRVRGATKAQVTVDGLSVPAASLGVPRPVNPGEHLIAADAAGSRHAERKLAVAPGARLEVDLELGAAGSNGPGGLPAATAGSPSLAPTPDRLPPAPPSPDDAGGTQRTLGYVALGLGGAGLVLGAITGSIAIDAVGTLEDSCPDEACPESEQSTIDRYDTTTTLSTVGFIAGGVLAATGVVLVLTAASNEPAGAALSVRLAPGLAAARVSF